MLALSILLGILEVAPAWACSTFMAPVGEDSARGTVDQPVQSLQRALDLAVQHPECDRVTINIAPGTYLGQQAVLMWGDATPGLRLVPSSRGVRFVGNGYGTWFQVWAKFGRKTPIEVRNLEISNYQTAISINGGYTTGGWNGSVLVAGNTFAEIGSRLPPQKPSTAVVRLVNSRGNVVEGNTFSNIRNIGECDGLHAIYLAHGSSKNIIRENGFSGGCGDTIKARDASNENTIVANTFEDQSGHSLFVDSFCQPSRAQCDLMECPSWGNVLIDNRYVARLGEVVPRWTRTVGPDQLAHCLTGGERVIERRSRLER